MDTKLKKDQKDKVLYFFLILFFFVHLNYKFFSLKNLLVLLKQLKQLQ